MANEKWTPGEREVAFEQVDKMLESMEIVSYRAHGYNPEIIDLACQRNALRDALEAAQWGFNHCRCSLCGGFNADPENPGGESDHLHTKTCPVALALAKSK
jgi:hypothetical protein